VAPLFLLLVLGYVWPIATLLWRSVDNPEVAMHLPRMSAAIGAWDGQGLPPDPVYQALAQDLAATQQARTTALVARRLNYAITGFRSLLTSTANRLRGVENPTRADFAAINPAWEDPAYWRVLKRLSLPLTADYLLAAVDRQVGPDGIVRIEDDRAVYVDALVRTVVISLSVCGLCLLLGLPVALLLAWAPPRATALLMALVLMPFWMSLLARSAAWVALLQQQGVINKLLVALGLTDQPLELIFNRTGVLIAMTHILLPYMILPLYGSLKSIPPSLVRAGLSLGASPWTTFRRIYLPLALPGVATGCILVVILSLGYYITPTLVGGAQDQMLAYFIAFNTNQVLNWGMAAALALVMLTGVGLLYLVYRMVARRDLLQAA
jgi:putative spermidine/putrescine transport system permease protein